MLGPAPSSRPAPTPLDAAGESRQGRRPIEKEEDEPVSDIIEQPQRRPRAATAKAATVAKIEHDSSGGDRRRRQQQEPSTVCFFAREGQDEASKMYFRGQRIWSAAMEELMANGMRGSGNSWHFFLGALLEA
ncbi:hypothetical protein Dimus_027372 [Dionaea muscipula]